ncbi:hypothetical protein EDD21DRAFT_17737 [Dissophora ornata]|nr:hypothetical protein EDD21DRAFT_17737 [Dissophora ornata]
MHYGELDGKQIFDKESVTEMLSAHTIVRTQRSIPEFSPSSAYGMGWFMETYKGQSIYYHGGNVLGFTSNIVLFPDSDLVVAVLSNIFAAQLPTFVPFYLADEILGLTETQDWMGEVAVGLTRNLYESIANVTHGTFPPRIKNKPATHLLHQYVGVYSNPLFGDMSITLEKSEAEGVFKKELHFQFNTFQSTMEHYHFDSFIVVFDLFSVKYPQMLTFITGEDGKIEGFQFKYLDSTEVLIKKKGSESHCDEEDEDVDMELRFGQESVQYRV